MKSVPDFPIFMIPYVGKQHSQVYLSDLSLTFTGLNKSPQPIHDSAVVVHIIDSSVSNVLIVNILELESECVETSM